MRVRTSVSIPKDLQARVEQFAEQTKRTISAVHEMALEAFLEGEQRKAACELSAVKEDDNAKGGSTGISKTE